MQTSEFPNCTQLSLINISQNNDSVYAVTRTFGIEFYDRRDLDQAVMNRISQFTLLFRMAGEKK